MIAPAKPLASRSRKPRRQLERYGRRAEEVYPREELPAWRDELRQRREREEELEGLLDMAMGG